MVVHQVYPCFPRGCRIEGSRRSDAQKRADPTGARKRQTLPRCNSLGSEHLSERRVGCVLVRSGYHDVESRHVYMRWGGGRRERIVSAVRSGWCHFTLLFGLVVQRLDDRTAIVISCTQPRCYAPRTASPAPAQVRSPIHQRFLPATFGGRK